MITIYEPESVCCVCGVDLGEMPDIGDDNAVYACMNCAPEMQMVRLIVKTSSKNIELREFMKQMAELAAIHESDVRTIIHQMMELSDAKEEEEA